MHKKALTSIALSAALACGLAACASSGRGSGGGARLDTLASWMAGTYTSEAQASTDPDNYFNVRMILVPVWTGRKDGRWLYVEQAKADSLDQPYRQRLYRLTAKGRRFESVSYALPNEGFDFIGAWRDPSRFDAITPQMLTQREGCELVLEWDEGAQRFSGSTVGRNCASQLQGAEYTTSEVTVTPTTIDSWDRGFDTAGNQVWGARMGGYRFVKVSK